MNVQLATTTLLTEAAKAIVGQQDVLQQMIIALLVRGHILL